MQVVPDHSYLGPFIPELFAPCINHTWTFCTQMHSYHELFLPWTIPTLDHSYNVPSLSWIIRSYPGPFLPLTIHTLNHSYPGPFLPLTINTLNNSHPGPFLPRTIHIIDFLDRSCPWDHTNQDHIFQFASMKPMQTRVISSCLKAEYPSKSWVIMQFIQCSPACRKRWLMEASRGLPAGLYH